MLEAVTAQVLAAPDMAGGPGMPGEDEGNEGH